MGVVRRGDRLDLAHVIRPAGQRPEIRLCESFQIEKGESDALARLGQSHGLKRHRCATLLGESEYRLVQLEAPAVPAEERIQALRWRLKDVVDFPVEGAAIAAADIPTEGSRQANVFAVISPSTVIGERMAVYRSAKLPLEAIDIPEMAVRNVAILFEDENRGLAFLALSEGESLLTITCRGELYLARRIEMSSVALADADLVQPLSQAAPRRPSTAPASRTAAGRRRSNGCPPESVRRPRPCPGWHSRRPCPSPRRSRHTSRSRRASAV